MYGRTAVVTGAAGGIGQALARSLAKAGATVAALDARSVPAAADDREPATPGLNVHHYRADVTRGDEVEGVVERIERDLGPIAALVNAAGILRVGEVAELTEDDWQRTLSVNATGVFLMSRAVARRMKERRAGAIVTVTSNAAQVPRWGMAAYAASKAAATSFTKCLGLELAPYGVRCNTVAPGSTHTPMLTALWGEQDALQRSIAGAPETFRVGIPLGKVARPDDIAAAVVFLLSDRASHITLQDLTIDGGAALGA